MVVRTNSDCGCDGRLECIRLWPTIPAWGGCAKTSPSSPWTCGTWYLGKQHISRDSPGLLDLCSGADWEPVHLEFRQHTALASDATGTGYVADSSAGMIHCLEIGDEGSVIHASCVCCDRARFVYIGTDLGIQVCDTEGRTAFIATRSGSFVR